MNKACKKFAGHRAYFLGFYWGNQVDVNFRVGLQKSVIRVALYCEKKNVASILVLSIDGWIMEDNFKKGSGLSRWNDWTNQA